MPIFETYAKRQKKLRGENPDVYQYDDMPNPLRVQIIHLFNDCLGTQEQYEDNYAWSEVTRAYDGIHKTITHELGVFRLPHSSEYANCYLQIINYILRERDVEAVLGVVEFACNLITNLCSLHGYRSNSGEDARKIARDTIQELNHRFKEHCVGYEYNGEILKISDQHIHQEVVKPALDILSGKIYNGPNQEYRNAHQHFRNANHKECLTDCLKALESTFKAIFDKRGWQYDPKKDPASKLIDIAVSNQLIPGFWTAHFTGLRTMLEAGVPTVRNKLSGHGQGSKQTMVPEHIASFTLHQTAAAIVFLAEAEKSLK